MDFHNANEMGTVAVEFPWSPSIGTWVPSREGDERGSVWRSKEVEVEGNPVLSGS